MFLRHSESSWQNRFSGTAELKCQFYKVRSAKIKNSWDYDKFFAFVIANWYKAIIVNMSKCKLICFSLKNFVATKYIWQTIASNFRGQVKIYQRDWAQIGFWTAKMQKYLTYCYCKQKNKPSFEYFTLCELWLVKRLSCAADQLCVLTRGLFIATSGSITF